MTENNPNPQNEPGEELTPPGQGLSTPFLQDSISAEKKDINLARRAVRERWAIPEATRTEVMSRLLQIVAKEVVEVPTKLGPAFLDGPADANAVAAARVLVAMDGLNQAEVHHQEKIEADASKKPGGDTFNIGCVGQIALGQEPLTPADAKAQAQAVLDAVRARVGYLKPASPPPAGENVVIDVTPVPPKPFGLDDL